MVRLLSQRTTRRRKFRIHPMVLSTIHRRLYRRSFRPSCVGGLTLPLRWGTMRSMPLLFNRALRASLS